MRDSKKGWWRKRKKREPGKHGGGGKSGGRRKRFCPVGWVCSQDFCFKSFSFCEKTTLGGLELLFRICVSLSNYRMSSSAQFSPGTYE